MMASAPIGVSLSNIDLDGCRAKKGRLPEKPPSSHCSLVTFLKRSVARLERPKARVNPYDDSFFGGSSPTMRTRLIGLFPVSHVTSAVCGWSSRTESSPKTASCPSTCPMTTRALLAWLRCFRQVRLRFHISARQIRAAEFSSPQEMLFGAIFWLSKFAR